MKRANKAISRFLGKALGVIKAPAPCQDKIIDPAEDALDASDSDSLEEATARTSEREVDSSHDHGPGLRAVKKFQNLLRDSLENICPWKNNRLDNKKTSPIDIPKKPESAAVQRSKELWGNHAPPNSSLTDFSNHRRVASELEISYSEPNEIPNRWEEMSNGFHLATELRHNLRRVDRSYNFAADHPEAYESCSEDEHEDEDEDSEDQEANGDGDDEDVGLIFDLDCDNFVER